MSLDDLQAQLRGALDQQFAALKTQYEQGIADARRQAAAEAERELQQKLDAARIDWETRLGAQVAAARAESEERHRVQMEAARSESEERLQGEMARLRAESDARLQGEMARLRTESDARLHAEVERVRAESEHQQRARVDAARAEAEQAASAAAAQERLALEQAVASIRRSAELELESERRRAQKNLENERAQGKAALEAERQRAQADVDRARQQAQPVAAPSGSNASDGRVLAAMVAFDGTQTLSQALEMLLQHGAAVAGRAALFLINGDRLAPWKAVAIPDVDVRTVESSIGARDLFGRAIQSGHIEGAGADLPAPPFARLPAGRTAVAVPLMVGGHAVAVLYADNGGDAKAAPGWPDLVNILARYASTTIALRTAARTLDVLRGGPDVIAADGEAESARRYARLLVSEIKLYNEGAVRVGRQQRDLRRRLRAEIDRAQRLYEDRVPADVNARQTYFQQELVQTLADGDATLLGN
jgi:hypothetical protein